MAGDIAPGLNSGTKRGKLVINKIMWYNKEKEVKIYYATKS
jgi:hypothetical protein